jgi:RHS repeat-associated protein
MQQRYYDPLLGRFLSTDSVEADINSGVNFNRYWYANNSPFKYWDPDGNEPAAQQLPSFFR